MMGKGGAVSMNNGTGTSTFFRPASNSTLRVLTFETDLSIRFSDRVFLDFDLFTTGVLSSERAFNCALFFAWGIF